MTATAKMYRTVTVTPERIDRLRQIYREPPHVNSGGACLWIPQKMLVGDRFTVYPENVSEDCVPESWLDP